MKTILVAVVLTCITIGTVKPSSASFIYEYTGSPFSTYAYENPYTASSFVSIKFTTQQDLSSAASGHWLYMPSTVLNPTEWWPITVLDPTRIVSDDGTRSFAVSDFKMSDGLNTYSAADILSFSLFFNSTSGPWFWGVDVAKVPNGDGYIDGNYISSYCDRMPGWGSRDYANFRLNPTEPSIQIAIGESFTPGIWTVTQTSVTPGDGSNEGGNPAPVPEPSTVLLLAAGLVGIGFARVRRQKQL